MRETEEALAVRYKDWRIKALLTKAYKGMYSASIPSTRYTIDSLKSSHFSLSAATKPEIQGLQDIIKTVQTLNLEFYPQSEIERGESIGEGETFWVERCKAQGKIMAIKRLKISSDSREEFIRRIQSLLLELQIMHHGPLKNHPNILTLLGYGWNTSGASILPYILVDYCSGGNLRQYLVMNKSPLGPQRDVLRRKELFMADIAAGIQALHTTGIIHGDVKLENILISGFDDLRGCPIARVCDFGHSIVQVSEEDTKGSGRYRGTARYNAPEIILRKSEGFDLSELRKCDIWAFGLLAWEVLLDGASYLDSLPSDTVEGSKNCGEDRHLLSAALPSAHESKDPIQRAIFKNVLKKTLQHQPHMRIDQLSSLVVMEKWRATSTTNLEGQLALHSGTSEWSYEIFRHDNEREIFWAHKSHIAEDFRSAFQSQDATDIVKGSAAWQLGCCYATGFGVSKDWETADEYFEQAIDLGSEVACNFGPMLLNEGFGHGGKTYGAKIRQMLSLDAVPTEMIFDKRQKIVSIQTTASRLLSEPSSKMAERIQQRLGDAIKRVSEAYASMQVQYEVSSLIRSLRAGNWTATQAFLTEAMSPCATDETGRSMFHWLFMIEDHAIHFVEESFTLLTKTVKPETLNQSAIQTIRVHAQWPLRLYGTPLMHAIATGSRNTVIALLKLGADPLAPNRTTDNIRSDTLWTAFHTAVEYHDAEILRILLENMGERAANMHLDFSSALCLATDFERFAMHGRSCKQNLDHIIGMLKPPAPPENIHGTDKTAKIALSTSSESNLSSLVSSLRLNNLHVVKALLNYDKNLARLQYVSVLGNRKVSNYPIHHVIQMASRRDDPSALLAAELIMKHDPDGLTRRDDRGLTCLHIAASGLSAHVINFIIERNPSLLHTRDRQGSYPVHYCESVAILEQLVSLGADLNVLDKQGRSPLFYAVSMGLSEVVDGLCRLRAVIDAPIGSPWNPLHAAILNSNFEATTSLVAYGAQVNLQDKAGDTPLHVAARRSSQYELQQLLDKDANVSVWNKANQYPLHVAATWNNIAAVQVLAKHKAGHILADSDRGDDVRPGVPRSPLYICAERLNMEAMHAMLQQLKKKDVEKQDRHQRSVIHYAAMIKNVPLILYLINLKVDIDACDENNDTPLLIAARSSFPASTFEACQVLIESGASVTHSNDGNEFAWDIAFHNRSIDIMIYLLSHSLIACRDVEALEVVYTRGELSYNRRCCIDGLLRIGIEQSNYKLLSTLKTRVQELYNRPPRETSQSREYVALLSRLQDVLNRLEYNPWSRLGEPTSSWLRTGWVGKEPVFEYSRNPAVEDRALPFAVMELDESDHRSNNSTTIARTSTILDRLRKTVKTKASATRR